MSLYRLACRITVALAAGATATLPWVDRTPNNYERGLTVAGITVAVVMIGSVVTHFRLPVLMVELAAALAVILFASDGGESLLSQEQRDASIVRTVLFTLAAATVALAVMLDQRRRRREGER